jgi:hypothetical protein
MFLQSSGNLLVGTSAVTVPHSSWSAVNERKQSRIHEFALASLSWKAFRPYPNPELSLPAARHVKPASNRLGWQSNGCEGWLVPDRPMLSVPTKDARHRPASTRRTQIYVVIRHNL